MEIIDCGSGEKEYRKKYKKKEVYQSLSLYGQSHFLITN